MTLATLEQLLEVIQSRSLLLDARIAFAKGRKRFYVISQFELAKQIGIYL